MIQLILRYAFDECFAREVDDVMAHRENVEPFRPLVRQLITPSIMEDREK